MPNDLEVTDQFNIVITPEQKELVKKTVFPDATDAELQLFFFDCTRRGIHPLDKLIHPTKRNGKYTPMTSIDLFRQRASESREHMGTDDAVYTGEPSKPDFAASVTVYKHLRGEKCAFTATARWSEYCPPAGSDFMWRKMPHLMLAKCAEALALRKAFPQQLHGLYTHEEMAQVETPRVSIPQVRPKQDATMVQPATDKYTGEPMSPPSKPPAIPKQEEDGAKDKPSTASDGTAHAWEEKIETKPAVSPSTFARQMADKMTDQFEDGVIGNLQPYQGTKAYQKGCRPGYFDLEDGQGGLVRKMRYFDPALDISSGLKRAYYRTETFKNQVHYTASKIESLE